MKGFILSLGLLASLVAGCPGHDDNEHRDRFWRRQSNGTVGSTAVSSSSTVLAATSTASAVPSATATIKSTILVIARDAFSASQATSGLNGYGIPFETLLVPQAGIPLPVLSTATGGNYGGIIAMSGLAYDYGADGWHSAITNDQWNQLYAYQVSYGVRMVQYDVYPQSAFGTTTTGGCCGQDVEQLVSFTNTTGFPQAGLKTGAGMSTKNMWHYITQITDPSTTWEIAQFAANNEFNTKSTAAVINRFGSREQMVWFKTWATDWSPTSNYLQHAGITWMTRGLYAGFRRVGIAAQIDDMMLSTPTYGTGIEYRVTPADMTVIRSWVPTILSKMNPGSSFRPEIGYNGNGNILAVDQDWSNDACSPHPIYTGYNPTDAEWKKPLGTGVDMWPATPTTYNYTSTCLNGDALSTWFQTATNRDQFHHLSHTFTHEHLNNATYADVYKEISFNQKWLTQVKLAAGSFSSKSLIPPAITGMHNGDALRAFYDLGLRNCVGDNARPALRNTQNKMWPVITNTNTDGFDGFTIIPRWPLRIYWNCDSPACTLQEWIDTSSGTGGFDNLMLQEKNDMMRYYFGLYRDGVMFHQINLRSQGMGNIATADGTVVKSLYQAWVEQTVQEFNRLANWPLVTLKQDDLAAYFVSRMTRDQCGYSMSYTIQNRKIVSVTVTANGNSCGAEIPITVPGTVTDRRQRQEKLGNDPLTVWVTLAGAPITLTLTTPISI
ncbi:hypothetical protein B0J11DRAFT_317353 [Dendryphion nanum]|uniref:Extracellular serine-rich protein n=1 Tax=Dendryphion nanum TaxID=256645 RepID=A0A9P9DQV8_9PLEO|nr:hypothetical protein B0J11DRAFT_317353 [Dendryphion nanum]